MPESKLLLSEEFVMYDLYAKLLILVTIYVHLLIQMAARSLESFN